MANRHARIAEGLGVGVRERARLLPDALPPHQRHRRVLRRADLAPRVGRVVRHLATTTSLSLLEACSPDSSDDLNDRAAYEAARGAGVEGVRAAGERQAPVGEEH